MHLTIVAESGRESATCRARFMPIVLAIGVLISSFGPQAAKAQVAPGSPAPAQTGQLSAAELEKLVGRIALYPDDLLAILLPGSTFPIDIVKAQRFLDRRKSDPNLKPDPNLPEPIRNLLNYPDVVKSMSDDLDWTEQLGNAVKAQQKDVLDAIQVFRRKTYTAGNLKTDEKQIVVVEKEVIQVVPADPQVIYVPQYQPSIVIVNQPAPVVAYYPTPYPVYYYSYPPGTTFATGFFAGAATAYAFSWSSRAIHYGVNAYELQEERYEYARNLQEDRQDYAAGAREDRQQASQDRQTQRQESIGGAPDQRQQTTAQRQEAAATQQSQSQQTAGARSQPQTWNAQTQSRQAQQQSARPGEASSFQSGAPGQQASAASAASSQQRGGGDMFSGSGSGSLTQQASQRGAQSRASFGGGQSTGRGGFSGGGRRR